MLEQTIYKETLYLDEYKGDISVIDKHIKHILEFDKGRKASNQGGYQSHDITFGFNELLEHILKCFKEIDIPVYLGNFWLNINKENNYNESHIHGSDMFSVVYFHKVCCEKPVLKFQHLIPTLVHVDYKLIPKNQMLAFFSGVQPHSVKPCPVVGHERISIAFNFRIIRKGF